MLSKPQRECVAWKLTKGHQLVAEAEVLGQNGLGLLAVRPDLVLQAAAMAAEVRLKRAVLEPADVQFAIGRVIRICRDEPTDVRGPVGKSG